MTISSNCLILLAVLVNYSIFEQNIKLKAGSFSHGRTLPATSCSCSTNGQEEQILTKQRKCNRLRPVWWSCSVTEWESPQWCWQCQDGRGTWCVSWNILIVCWRLFKNCVREEFCTVDWNQHFMFIGDTISSHRHIHLQCSPWTKTSGGCSRFCISRVSQPSHPTSFLPWPESHCSRCCWLLSWHHGPCPVASWHQKCKKTWNMWQEAAWEAGSGRGSCVSAGVFCRADFTRKLLNGTRNKEFPTKKDLVSTSCSLQKAYLPTCWLPFVFDGG